MVFYVEKFVNYLSGLLISHLIIRKMTMIVMNTVIAMYNIGFTVLVYPGFSFRPQTPGKVDK